MWFQMTRSRCTAFVLVAAFVLGCGSPAGATPFVFPDRPDLLFAFPESPIEIWHLYPDEIAFPNDSSTAGLPHVSGGGGSGGSASGITGSGTNQPRGFSNVGDPKTFGFDTPLNPFAIDPLSQGSGAYTAPTNVGGPFPGSFSPLSSFAPTEFVGSFAELPFSSVIAGPTDTLRYSPAPEPASLLLVGAGLTSLAVRRFRRRPLSSGSS